MTNLFVSERWYTNSWINRHNFLCYYLGVSYIHTDGFPKVYGALSSETLDETQQPCILFLKEQLFNFQCIWEGRFALSDCNRLEDHLGRNIPDKKPSLFLSSNSTTHCIYPLASDCNIPPCFQINCYFVATQHGWTLKG